jgi:very-short-patch-repair endonuclease
MRDRGTNAMASPSLFTGEGGARPRSAREGEGTGPDPKELLARARLMRANPTEAEKRLWTILRGRRLAAFKFRRQQILHPYMVDFVCFERRLIVEADGSQHADSRGDALRDAFLRSQGFRLLRFWNNHILGERDSVAAAIFAAVSSPHPAGLGAGCPSPARGEGVGATNG